jgi:hypothetical protein
MTPGDPRIANVFVLGFASLAPWLLWRVVLRRAKTSGDVRKTIPFFLAFGGFLLVNALWSASSGAIWARLANQTPVVTRSGLERRPNQDQILLAGTVSRTNQTAQPDVVYLVDDGSVSGPLELTVELQDAQAAVTGVDAAFRWNWQTESAAGRVMRSRLRVGQPVVVWGTVEHGRPMAQPQAGPIISTRAALVFCGTTADLLDRARAEGARWYPRVLAWLSLAAALLAIGVPLVYLRRVRAIPQERQR